MEIHKNFKGIYRDPFPTLMFFTALISDQLSKLLIIAYLPVGQSWPANGVFRLTHTWNTGAAFSLFQDKGAILTGVAVVAVIFILIIYKYLENPPLLIRLAFGLQMGGAIGNLIDRFRLGYVTDFIDVGWWPVFNIADSSIVMGITVMAFYFTFLRNRNPKTDDV